MEQIESLESQDHRHHGSSSPRMAGRPSDPGEVVLDNDSAKSPSNFNKDWLNSFKEKSMKQFSWVSEKFVALIPSLSGKKTAVIPLKKSKNSKDKNDKAAKKKVEMDVTIGQNEAS